MKVMNVSCGGAWFIFAAGVMAVVLLGVAGCGGSNGPTQHEQEVQAVRKALKAERVAIRVGHQSAMGAKASLRRAEECLRERFMSCVEEETANAEVEGKIEERVARSLRLIHRDINRHSRAVIEEAMRSDLEAGRGE
jgi:hypothetical protein